MDSALDKTPADDRATPNASFTSTATDHSTHAPTALKRQDTMSLNELRHRQISGAHLQQRVACVAFGLGIAMFVVGLACDIFTGEGILGLHPKLANLFQPVWMAGVHIALLGLLPSYRRGQNALAFIYLFVCPAAAVVFPILAFDTLSVICTDSELSFNLTLSESCAAQAYSTAAYSVAGLFCSVLVLTTMRRHHLYVAAEIGRWQELRKRVLLRVWDAERCGRFRYAGFDSP